MHRGRFFGLIVAILVVMGTAQAATPASSFGRYLGIFRHEGIKRDQLAKLDFILSREEGNTIYLKAVLTLHFGDYRNKEYVSYHFDDVRFNILTKTFVFDQADQPVTFVGTQTGNGNFEGEFRSSYSGHLGKVILKSDDIVKPELPLIEPVWGEYRGMCQEKTLGGGSEETSLQLYSYRSSAGAAEEGNPFRAYNIIGLLGVRGGSSIGTKNTISVWGNVRSGAYNFYKNQLKIFSNYRDLTCSVDEKGDLNCGVCSLKRVSTETQGPRLLSPPVFESALNTEAASIALAGTPESIQGEYVGYVHHDRTGHYQRGSLNVLTYQAPPKTGEPITLRMSAVATLFFGEGDNEASIAYKFNERNYPNPVAATQFVLNQPNTDVDAVLQITSIGKGVVKGNWFSQTFGRLGGFEFHKGDVPQLPAAAVIVNSVSGRYESSTWKLSLSTGPSTSEPGSENPFSPLNFGGWIVWPELFGKKEIIGGTFDFYTGRIGLELEDNSIFVGETTPKANIFLKNFPRPLLAVFPNHSLQPYRKMEPFGGFK